ncbi:zinc-ribbon domain-containing protein [Butyrivibrio fibrisolvens]|uniref:Zinc-ribbon domain-containing protein n=1 Tax=Butyrivibrio fibrisolvens TaxID=831 RepID=A0A317G305_BUTFI|nr:zinc ribbon domain-containing protein [Butyrivibrio fibrisolvens]PWT28318.1 hypothetical protein CPT75_14905 [Butyrivibrio fibrisolvens]
MIYCNHCGKELPDDSMFCNHCGSPISGNSINNAGVYNAQPQAAEKNTLAIWALVCSLLMFPVGYILGVIGVNIYTEQQNKTICKIAIAISVGILISILGGGIRIH